MIFRTKKLPGLPWANLSPHREGHSIRIMHLSRSSDGKTDDPNLAWWSDPYPQWIRIDLKQPRTIRKIQVFPLWDQIPRVYRYTVETSMDGMNWKTVADMSKNEKPSTAEGFMHEFHKTTARYVRVNMLYHNLNKGIHLVEVRVFEK